jgi:membrane carboxypeptidase/penicillin-binding protein
MPHNGKDMEFLTLHELSRELNKPERQLRHKFKNLLKKNILIDGEDFIREGYIDDQHFVFKINPVRFVELTQLNPAHPPDNTGYQVGTTVDNNRYQVATKSVNNTDTTPQESGTNGGNQQPQSSTSDTQEIVLDDITNDYIELLKEQLREKDKQLAVKDEQLKSKDDLLKLAHEQAKEKDNAQILALGEIIRLNKKLLPPSAGETVRNVDTNGYHAGNQMDTTDGNQASDVGNNFANSGYHDGNNNRE